jgi:hypothetical protein
MSYSSLSSNQTISFTNLQSGVSEGYFTAKTTIPINLKQITKTEANTYVNINTSLPSYAAKAPNELVTKNDLSGITSASPYTMYGIAGTAGYKSLDGGNTFTALSGLPALGFPTASWSSIAGDITGLNIAAVSFTQAVNQIYISNDGGVSFTARTLGSVPFTPFYPTNVAMSDNGQYIAVACMTQGGSGDWFENSNAVVCVSSNYGASFSANYIDSVTEDILSLSKVSVSGNGQYITAVFSHRVDPGFPNAPRPFSFRVYSSNYGTSFTKSGSSEFNLYLDIALSYTGQYQFLTSDYYRPGVFGGAGIKAYVSNNYGTSFTERYSNTGSYIFGANQYQGFVSATISDDGKTMVGATNGDSYFIGSTLPPVLISSTNFGNSFPTVQGFNLTIGIAGGNVVTAGITNNYIAMMLYSTGQFSYSVDGGTSFTSDIVTGYLWKQIYRKAFVYSTTTTTTTIPGPSGYDYYLADEYNCSGCSITGTNVLVRFPTGTSVIINRFYADIGGTGFVYQITQSTSSGSPSILLTLPSSTSCAGACSL